MWIVAGVVSLMSLLQPLASAQTSNFSTGVTFTQYSLDAWGDADAVARGKALLNNSTTIVNQHIMGFGALNPEPFDDDYQFDSIDRRIGIVNGAGKDADVIALTACCAPDWMKGGQPGETDWSKIEVAPLPEHFDDYAELVAEIVQRPEFSNIRYLHVWNEMKGFWDSSRNRWNHEAYTVLYNKVWTAVKAVRQDIKIGGPYVFLNSFGDFNWNGSDFGGDWGNYDKRDLEVITYWLENKVGADFIVVDSTSNNRDGIHPVDQFERTQKFADFMVWLRSLDESTYPGATTLPMWWAEWYINVDNGSASQDEKNAVMATGMIRTIKSGASAALIWGPQGDANGDMFPLGLFSETRIPNGGQPTPYYATHKHLHDHFAAGVRLIERDIDNKDVEILASDKKALVVNKTSSSQSFALDNKQITLQPWQVRLLDTGSETPPQISVSDESVDESSATAEVTLTLSSASDETVSVIAFTRKNSAQPGSDYYGKTETVRFAPGSVRETISIDILNDIEVEGQETLEIRLANATKSDIGDGVGVLTIVDNDGDSGVAELAIDSIEVDEGLKRARVPVRLSNSATEPVSVLVFTQANSATPGSDYYGRTTRLRFAPGQTQQSFDIELIDDTRVEDAEQISLRIKEATGAAIAVETGVVNLIDND